MGGYFGPLLKFAGWDALEVQGKAERGCHHLHRRRHRPRDHRGSAAGRRSTPTRSPISSPRCTPKDEADRRNVSVVSAGQGSEHTRIGCLNVSWYDPRARQGARQAGRPRRHRHRAARQEDQGDRRAATPACKADSNDPADLKRIRAVGQRINKEIVELDDEQNKMRRVGTAHLVEIMNDYDLLPVHNFKFGSHPDSPKINSQVWDALFTQRHPRLLLLRLHHGLLEGRGRLLLRTGPYAGQMRHRGRAGVRDGGRLRLEPRHLQPARHHRAELLLRHLRHRLDLLRHADRLRHGVLRGGHPGPGEDRRAGAALRQRRRRDRAAAPDGARRGLRADRGHGRARR